MNILKNKMQRRSFLRNVARAGLLIPFSGQFMLASKAMALNGVAKRFVFVYYPNGVARGDDKFHQFNIGGLTTNSFGDSPLMHLAGHADKLVAFKNLNFNGVGGSSGHPEACETLFSGGNHGPTFDVALGEALGGRLTNNLHLGVWSSRVQNNAYNPFSDRNGNKLSPLDDPQIFFNNNLSSFATGGNSSPEDDTRKRVLESLHENLDMLQAETLNATQTTKLQNHEDALNFYQTILNSNLNVGDGIVSPGIGMNGINEEAEQVAMAQTRNIAMSFQADVSNVATLQLMSAQDETLKINFPSIYDQLGAGIVPNQLEWNEMKSHVASHSESVAFVAHSHWYAMIVKNLIDELSTRADPTYGGMIMDHTVVLVMSEMGGGNHQQENTGTYVLAGNDTGVNTGMGIDAGGRTSADLFVDIANVFGLGWGSYGRSNGNGGIPGFR